MNPWLNHWNLTCDPFDSRRSAFVETPTHGEAVARLVHTIESAGRSAVLIAEAGSGKSRVLAKAMEKTRNPNRRFARVVAPLDGTDLFARLATELGGKGNLGGSRSAAWRALVEAVRLCHWQGLQVVLVVDDCHELQAEADQRDLERLNQLDPDPSARLTVIRLGRPSESKEFSLAVAPDWSLAIRLEPLTRSETADYVGAKLAAAGRFEATFTPRAISRLHAASAGSPRGIDRLAGLALIASALRGLEMVPPDVVDEASADCRNETAVIADL